MNILILGNVISFIGCALMVAIGFIKSKKVVLATQCVQFSIQAAANLILGAVSGAVCGVVGVARNLMITRVKHVAFWKTLFIVVQVGLSLLLDGFGLLIWLPIVSASIFTWFIDVKSPVRFKVVIIAAQSLWVMYDFCYQNYVALAFDVFTVLSNFVGIWLLCREEKS